MAAGRVPRKVGEGLLIFLLLFLPWFEGGGTPAALFVSHTIVFLLLGIVLVAGHRSGAVAIASGWETPAGLAFVVACVVSFLGVDYFFGPFLSVWNVILAALLALALVMMGSDGWRRRALALAGAGAAQAIVALVMPAPANLTPMGTFANASQMAAYLGLAAMVSAGLALDAWRDGSRWRVVILTMAAALDLAAMVRAGSRGALAAVLLAGAVWIAVSARHTPRRVRLGLWGALVLLAVLGVAGVAARFDRVSDPYRFDRLGIWGVGIKAGLEHPILGMGPGIFEARANRYNFPLDREMFRYSKRINSAHSTWVQVFAATGFTGFAALAVFVWLLVWRLIGSAFSGPRAGGLAAGVLFSTVACLVHGLVETPFDVPAVTWTLMALIVPLVAPDDPSRSAFQLSFRPNPWVTSALIVSCWSGGVLLPYAAHATFVSGLRSSVAGLPAAGLEAAIRLNPYNPLYRTTRARFAWRRDRPLTPATVAAVDLDLERARELDPGAAEPRLLLAQLHARVCFEILADTASIGRTETYYREAIDLDGHDPRPHVGLALFLLAQQRPAEAIELLRQAVTLEPRYVAAHAALTRALLDTGDRAGAAGVFAALEETLSALTGYFPKNGYEEDLMKSDPRMLAGLRERLR